MAKLTDNSNAIYEYLKANGGRVSIDELCSAFDKTPRSIGANVTDLTKKGLAKRDYEEVEGADKPVTYAVLEPDHEATFEALPERK